MTSIKILLGALMCLSLFWNYIKPINPNSATALGKPRSQYISGDIAHIKGLTVFFENREDSLIFDEQEALDEWLEHESAYATCIHGYKDDLDFLVRNGFVWTKTVYNGDEQYTELIYDGPNWTVDATQDTSYVIATFNTVEKVYNPTTKSFEFDSYSID
jgi:hypothetical protein